MTRLLRFLAINAGLGFACGVAFACLLVLGDAGGLGGLMSRSSDGVIALLLLQFFCGLTFASLVVGGAVMLQPYRDEEP